MKNKFMRMAAVLFVISCAFFTLRVDAYDCMGMGCGPCGKMECCPYAKCEPSCPFQEKFEKKVCFILSNEAELGISKEQVEKIRKLKMDAKKKIIKNKAEIEILMLEMKAEIHKDSIDKSDMKKLMEKKLDHMKEIGEALIDGFAEIKEILTKEQKDKMKMLWKKEMKELCPKMGACPLMKGK